MHLYVSIRGKRYWYSSIFLAPIRIPYGCHHRRRRMRLLPRCAACASAACAHDTDRSTGHSCWGLNSCSDLTGWFRTESCKRSKTLCLTTPGRMRRAQKQNLGAPARAWRALGLALGRAKRDADLVSRLTGTSPTSCMRHRHRIYTVHTVVSGSLGPRSRLELSEPAYLQ